MSSRPIKLLVCTQKVDRNDSDLGFFHVWLEKMASQVDSITVICLEKGEYKLPSNVTVLSLGKEYRISRIAYLFRFYYYLWQYRRDYDAVFVHMNPEYAILGGLPWRLWGKKVLLWYMHKAVNFRLWLAEKFVTKIFTASKESFRLPSKKVEVTGHGIDVDHFASRTENKPDNAWKFLWVGRISPVKDLETVILAVAALKKMRPNFSITLDVVGEPITNADREYKRTIEELVNKEAMKGIVRFAGGKKYSEMLGEYGTHHALIHTSRTGSLDKVVLEALAAGILVFTSSEAYAGFGDLVVRFSANNYEDLAQTIEKNMISGILDNTAERRNFVRERHNLNLLVYKIDDYLSLDKF